MSRRIKFFGKLVIEEDGRPSPLAKKLKGCALLAYLAVTGEPQPREVVADLLWNAATTAQSLRNLRVLLNRIRPLSPELEVSDDMLVFRPQPDLEFDLLTFSAAVKSSDIAALDKGLRVYDGDFMAGFQLKGISQFNEWLLFTRERLRQQATIAFDTVCRGYVAQKQWERAVKTAERWLALDDLDERAYRWLITSMAGNGLISQALEQYERCRQRLWQEMRVQPEPATIALAEQLSSVTRSKGDIDWYSRIQHQLPGRGELAEPGPLPINAIVPYHRNEMFVGRHDCLLELVDLLLPILETETMENRLAIVTGMGGVGKTQLAVEFCYRYGQYLPGGVYWLNFDDAKNIAAEVARLGDERGMGLYKKTGQLSVTERVGRVRKAWQEGIPRLLIFDNCEEEQLLVDWLPVTGGSKVLVTSRRGQWSREFEQNVVALNVLSQSESISLLHRLAPKIKEDEAAEIAAEVGHLPLALHLAGGFLRRYQKILPEIYLAQLRDKNLLDHPSLQGQGLSYSPTNHELNVGRTLAINLERLDLDDEIDEMALHLFVRAACFSTGEPIPQSLLRATVLADADDLMAVLLAEDALARLVALGFLEAKGRESVVLHRLVAAFLLANPAAKELFEQAQTAVETVLLETIDIYQQEDHLLVQLPFSANHLQHVTKAALSRWDQRAARLATTWGYHLYLNSDLTNAVPYLSRAREICEVVYGPTHPETAAAVSRDGWVFMHSGDYHKAKERYQQALAIQEGLPEPDPLHLANCYRDLGTLHWRQGQYTEARQFHEKELALREGALGNQHPLTAQSLSSLGIIMAQIGDLRQARSYQERALMAVANEPETSDTARLLTNLASTCSRLGDLQPALHYARRSLQIRERIFGLMNRITATAQNNLGMLLVQLGEIEAAGPYLEQALAVRTELLGRDHLLTARSLCNMGDLQRRMEKYVEAQETLEAAIRIYEAIRPTDAQLAQTYNHLGDLFIAIGDLDAARLYLDKALAIWEGYHSGRSDKAHTLISLGDWFQAVGDVGKARQVYSEALAILEAAVLPSHPERIQVEQILSEMQIQF